MSGPVVVTRNACHQGQLQRETVMLCPYVRAHMSDVLFVDCPFTCSGDMVYLRSSLTYTADIRRLRN